VRCTDAAIAERREMRALIRAVHLLVAVGGSMVYPSMVADLGERGGHEQYRSYWPCCWCPVPLPGRACFRRAT
jgi:hypothetical protein